MAKKKSILKGVQEKEAAFNEKLVKPIEIGYDKDRAFTLTNAGSLTGAHLSEEMTDYIIQEAEKAGIDLQTAFGIAAAESTLGNPTDDKSAWNISSGIRRAFDNVYPGTEQHINTYGDVVNEQELFNFYYPLENQNPYTLQIAEADRQARKGKDFELALIDGMSYADKLAQKPVPTGSVAQLAFEYFKLNGEGYAPGYKEQTGQSYVQHVRKKGKEALQSPEIQRAIANYALKKIGRPKEYSFGTFDVEPVDWHKKAEGGPLNLKPWEGLSMRERAAYIRDAVSRGLNTVTDIRNDYNEFKGGGKKKTNNSSVLTFLNLLNESLKGNSRYNTTGWRKYLTDLAKMESSYRGDVTNSIGAKGYFLLMPSNRSASWATPTQLFHEMYKLSDAHMDYFRKNMTERDLKLAELMGIDIYGLMAGAHLGGPKNALAALRGGRNSKDKNGTSVLSYMTRFSQTTPRQPISGDFKTVYFQPPIEETPEVEAPNPYVGYKLISLEDIDNLPLPSRIDDDEIAFEGTAPETIITPEPQKLYIQYTPKEIFDQMSSMITPYEPVELPKPLTATERLKELSDNRVSLLLKDLEDSIIRSYRLNDFDKEKLRRDVEDLQFYRNMAAYGGNLFSGEDTPTQLMQLGSPYWANQDMYIDWRNSTINGETLPEVTITPTNDASWLFSMGKYTNNSRKPLADSYTRKVVANYLSKFDAENAKDYNARITRLADAIFDTNGVIFQKNDVKEGKLKGRAHYNPNTGIAKIDSMDDIFSELAHPYQSWLGNNMKGGEISEEYDSDKDPRGGTRYAYPDTYEGETHGFFEPTLKEWIETGKIGRSLPILDKKLSKEKIVPETRREVTDSAASWNRQAVDRRILANSKQLPITKRIKYSISNFPLLNKRKKALGGNLFDGTTQPTQQMNSVTPFWMQALPDILSEVAKYNREKEEETRRKVAKLRQHVAQSAEAALQKESRDYLTTSNDNTTTVSSDAVARATKPAVNPHLKERGERGAAQHAAWEKDHPNLAAWSTAAAAAPFVVAATPLMVGAGDALAATTAGQATTTGLTWLANAAKATPWIANSWPWLDAGLTSLFGAHGVQEVANGNFTPTTALELAPLLLVTKPMVEMLTPKQAVFNSKYANTKWYQDLVKLYGLEETDAMVDLILTKGFLDKFFGGRTLALAAKEARDFEKVKELHSKISGNPEEGKAVLGGSPAIGAEGTINRSSVVPHDLDYMAYINDASKNPNTTMLEAYDGLRFTLDNIRLSPILQTLRDALGEDINVYRIPELFRHNRNLYRKIHSMLYGDNNLYVSPLVNYEPEVGLNKVLLGKLDGVPVDLFLSETPIMEGPTSGMLDASTPLAWKNAFNTNRQRVGLPPRGKDVRDLEGFTSYSAENPLVTETSGQWSPFSFGDRMMEEGMPSIFPVETYPGSGEYIPSALSFDGSIMPVGSRLSKTGFTKTPQVTAESAVSEMPNIIRTVLDNGKIRLSLPSHTDAKPRLLVIEPLGDNKYYVHTRTWDGDHIPANMSASEKQALYDALYEELPEGAEILLPESGEGYYATRGTVAGLQRLARDPRFTPGTRGTLLYLDKDGKTIRTYEGTSFIKSPRRENANADIDYTYKVGGGNNETERLVYWNRIHGKPSYPSDTNGEGYAAGVVRGLPWEAQEGLLNNTVARNMREFAAEGVPESELQAYADKAKEVMDGVYIGRYPNSDYVKAGWEGFSGFYDDAGNFISVNTGTRMPEVSITGHEGRHLLDHQLDDNILMPKSESFGLDFDKDKALAGMLRAVLKQRMMLTDAYDGDFLRIPKTEYGKGLENYNMERDAITTNKDARDVILLDHGAENWSPEKQNELIDKMSDDEVFNAVFFSNGYGERFIRLLKSENKLTPKKAQQFREAMKHVGVAAFPVAAGVGLLFGLNNL